MGNRGTDVNNGRRWCCCRSRLRSRRQIVPEVGDYSSYKILEVRPKRVLKICHLNPRPRDEKFSREMQLTSKYEHLDSASPIIKKHQNQGIQRADPVNLDQPDDVCLPHSISYKEKPAVTSSTPKRNTRIYIQDDPFDRGHSASSVSLSLTAQHNVPHMPQTSIISEQPLPENTSSVPTSPFCPRPKGGDMRDSVSSSLDPPISSQPASPLEGHAVLFFIHGVGGSSDTWRAQMDYFSAAGYEIVAPDLIGHGFSQAPDSEKAYHFEEISKDLEVIFDRFCKRCNVIIAHSYGCSFAAVLARRRSRRVNKIVLISGGGPIPLAPQPGVFHLPKCMLVCVRPCLDCGFQKSAFHGDYKKHRPKEKALDIPTYALRHTMNGQIWPDGDHVFHNWLNVSALLIHGKHDKLVTIEEEKQMEEAIYGARLQVVEESSHMVMIEQPDKVNALIHQFILLADTDTVDRPRTADGDMSRSRVSLKSRTSKSLPHDLIASSLKLRESLSD